MSETKIEAVAKELLIADVVAAGEDLRKVAAFIVERDAKRDAAWMRYSDARVELARAQEMSSGPVIEAATAELRAAAEALRALGIDVDVPSQVVQR